MIEIKRHCPIKPATHTTGKFSFKEKRELERLEKEIREIETEKKVIENELHSGNLSIDELTRQSERFAAILVEIELKTNRWMELSERESSEV